MLRKSPPKLSGMKTHVKIRQISPCKIKAGWKLIKLRKPWTGRRNTIAVTITTNIIKRGMPNFGYFWQNLFIARPIAFKKCPPIWYRVLRNVPHLV